MKAKDGILEIEANKVYVNLKNISLIDGTKDNKGKVLVMLSKGTEMWVESSKLIVLV